MLKKLSKPSGHLISLLLVSLLLILFGHFSTDIASFVYGDKSESGFYIFLTKTLPEFKSYGIILLLGGLVTYFAANGIEVFVREKISPLIEGHVEDLSTQLKESSDTTKSLLSTELLTNMIKASPRELVRGHLKEAHVRAYGDHCGSSQSLYSALENKFKTFLQPNKPHRSDYNQTVTVVDNGSDSIIWHEVCTYKIHTISLSGDKQANPITHNIRFSSTIKVAELGDFENEDPKYSLSIIVEGEEIFSSKKDLTLSQNKVIPKNEIEGLKIYHVNETLTIELDKKYQIKKEWTHIEIKETSTILDDYLISRRNEPTCGANINITLPDGWSFELIQFGHPNDWTIHQHPVNTLSATTKRWLFPGITFFCKWNKPDMQQIELNETVNE